MPARLRGLWHAGRETAAAYSRNLCPQLAAAIAYRVLFSLVPLAIFLVSIFGLLIQNAQRRDEIVTWIVDNLLLSPEGSVRLDEAISGLGQPLSAVGLVALIGVLWAASGMMGSLRVALTNIWGTERRRAWRGKTFDLVLVLLAGVLLLVAFGLTLAVRVVERLGERIGSAVGMESLGSAAGDVAQAVVSLALVFGTVLLLYRYVPPVRPRFAELWAPALLAAVAIVRRRSATASTCRGSRATTSSTGRSQP